jgi:hypothetical protein
MKKEIEPVHKYDFQNGGEFDVNANYLPPDAPKNSGNWNKGRLSIRQKGDEYQLYVHFYNLKDANTDDDGKVLLSSKNLSAVCRRATEENERLMRKMFSSIKDSEIPVFDAVPDEIADDIYKKTGYSLEISSYWRRYDANGNLRMRA